MAKHRVSVVLIVFVSLIIGTLQISAYANEEEWTCAKCGAVSDGDWDFCTNCGEMRPENEWICEVCGQAATGNFCNVCGRKKPNAETDENYITTNFSASTERIGNATVRLKKGFAFINKQSRFLNIELALTAVTLSAQIYTNASGDKTEAILEEKLGYDDALLPYNGVSSVLRPVACYGYKQLEEGKNLFAVVIRGTDGGTDIETDLADGLASMFSISSKVILEDLLVYMQGVTQKTEEEIKEEENYFFFTGHSLGGAVANNLSIDDKILEFVNQDIERIYTYTFESPHTCEDLLWMDPQSMSNAYNFKVVGDAVTNIPPHLHSTTYGKDVSIKVSLLNNDTYRTLFPDSEEDTIEKAVSVEGHQNIYGLHDTCLGLIFLEGIADKMIVINSQSFPDEYFRGVVSAEYDLNKDGYLSIDEINAVTFLVLPDTPIESVKGIEFFTELQYMEIAGFLRTMDCSENPLLEELNCESCSLNSLNVKECKNLKRLLCGGNELTKLDVSGCQKLEALDCEYNQITSLDISGCSDLRHLSCESNNISVLDISNCPLLIDVYQNGEAVETPEQIFEGGEKFDPYISYKSGNAESSEELYDYDYYQQLSVDSNVSIVF